MATQEFLWNKGKSLCPICVQEIIFYYYPEIWENSSPITIHLTLIYSPYFLSQGKCFPCADNECPLMGHRADKFTVTGGISKTKYFLTTGTSKPFGRKYYASPVKMKIQSKQSMMNFIFLHTVKKNQKVLHITLTRAKQAMMLFTHFAWITAVILIQVISNLTRTE